MGTISDKLAELKNTKNDIKLALREKNGNPTEVFSTYADIIRGFNVIRNLSATTEGGIGVTGGSAGAQVERVYVEGTQLICALRINGAFFVNGIGGDINGLINVKIPIC